MPAEQSIDEEPLRSSAERLRHELDRWMDAAWSQGERAIDAIGLRPDRTQAPPVDVIERGETILVLVNIPGLNPDEINLTLAGNMLTLQGEFPPAPVEGSDELKVRERPQGSFRRSIPLPAAVDAETISAECRQGVLEVTVTKIEREQTRHVKVRSSEAST